MRIQALFLPLFISVVPTMAQIHPSRDVLDSIGAINAVKKAHQMADLPIRPVATLHANKKKTYEAGKLYSGLIYSSAKELNNFVGQDVSIHTFMTALHNPRSVLYTERIDLPPYHGVNCMAYYGTVCSGLITYALGFKITQRSGDILVDDRFELIKDQSAGGIKLADLVCRKGHPAMVTGIERDSSGKITRVEMTSARQSGCCRYYIEGEEAFNNRLKQKGLEIYRYKHLYKNTSYTPCNEFVAVEGEKLKQFHYNESICANKGDRSCYISGDSIVLNIFGDGDKVEVYKDSKLYKEIIINKRNTNVLLRNYPNGDYKARVVKGKEKSDFTHWKIIDVNLKIEMKQGRIYFSSANATPVYYEFCNVNGSRPTNKNRIYVAEFTEEERKNGYANVHAPKRSTDAKSGYTCVKVHFECEYGMVINKPINWFK